MNRYPQVQLANANSTYGQWANKLFDRFVAPLMRLRGFQMAYSRAMDEQSTVDLWTRILQQLNTKVLISETDLARIPRSGPVIIVANHPHGIMDGVLLGSLMHRVRDDFKIIMNEATTMPGLEDSLLFVSIFSTAKENARKNAQVMRKAVEWLQAGHAIVIFPAGEISAISHIHEKIALDNSWNNSMIRLSARTDAPILPLYIAGQNDALFLKLGLIHPVFRTLQIGRVTNQLFGENMLVRAAQPIPSNLLTAFNEDVAKVNFIRAQLYSLMSRDPHEGRRIFDVTQNDVLKTSVTSNDIKTAFELLSAQADFNIRENNSYTVLLFNQAQLLELGGPYAAIFPLLKDEIGRLRELTFRDIGEGSDKTRDLDVFDEYYSHLTLWDREQKQLVGAYRIAFTEEILPQYGRAGFYTASQFEYDDTFFDAIGPAIELSRAFIVKEYQKTSMALSMLLGALGQLLLKGSPYIRSFFGAVSVSNQFQGISKKLIVDFLNHYHGNPAIASLVKAKNPPHLDVQMPEKEWQRLLDTVSNCSLLNAVVSSIEPDGKTVPPLIPIYIALTGCFVSFDHDIGFNSIDGLLVINTQLAATAHNTMMRRLMGKDYFEQYCQLLQ